MEALKPPFILGSAKFEFLPKDGSKATFDQVRVEARTCDEGTRKAYDIFKRQHPELDYDNGTLYCVESWQGNKL